MKRAISSFVVFAFFSIAFIPLNLWATPNSEEYSSADINKVDHETAPGSTRAQNISEMMLKERAARSKEGGKDQSAEIDTSIPYLKMMQGLGIVAGMFLILVHLYKKYIIKDESSQSRKIRIIERTTITPKSSLVLAVVDGKRYLLGVGPDPVTITPLETIELDQAIEEDAAGNYINSYGETCHEVIKLSA